MKHKSPLNFSFEFVMRIVNFIFNFVMSIVLDPEDELGGVEEKSWRSIDQREV